MVPSVQAPNKSAHPTASYSHQEILDASIKIIAKSTGPPPHETKDSWQWPMKPGDAHLLAPSGLSGSMLTMRDFRRVALWSHKRLQVG